jgi:hypothetical protein
MAESVRLQTAVQADLVRFPARPTISVEKVSRLCIFVWAHQLYQNLGAWEGMGENV